MPTNSIQKALNVGHEITLHLADPTIPVNTTWSGYVNPSAGYSVPPNPYKEPDNNPVSSQDNIRKSTGFDGIEPGTPNQFLRVPLDGTPENASTTYSGGGFVLDNASGLTCGFIVNQSTSSIDVDVTAMVRWYIQNRGANPSERMRILGKGSYVKPTSPDVETPYGYFTDFAPPGAGQRPSESYMITAPTGAVDDTTEVVTAPGRRAMVHFYSFGETADQYSGFIGQYGNGSFTTQVNYVKTTGDNVILVVDSLSGTGTLTIPKSNSVAVSFWNRLKPNINTTDTFTTTITVTTADGTPAANTTGSIANIGWIETSTSIVVSFDSYSSATLFPGGGQEIINSITFSMTRTGRSYFKLTSFGSPASVFSDAIFTNHYPTVDSGSFFYFPSGVTLTANAGNLSSNAAGKKRFKIIRSLPSSATSRHYLEVEPWSNFTSADVTKAILIPISTGIFRPKMIVSYNS